MDFKNKRYIVGAVTKMQELFPQYAGNDARFSLDQKQVIYEFNLSDDELAALKRKTSIKIYTYEEILAFINAPESAGVWYQQEAPTNTITDNTIIE